MRNIGNNLSNGGSSGVEPQKQASPGPTTTDVAVNDVQKAASRSWTKVYLGMGSIPFWGVHLTALIGVFALGWSAKGFALAIALYFVRMFFVTAGYHRYFSHRTYKTSRFFQFVLAWGASTSLQKGVLWWAAHHRRHHKYSDTPKDVHSPRQYGFWWSQIGWILAPDFNTTDMTRVPDLARYPELRWINRYHLIPGITLAVLLFLVGGAHALIWGFFVSTTLLWHGTFTINSLTHVFGRRRYLTTDDSRNSFILALITMGEGWHNNHHHYQSAAQQGFRWYELDLSYLVLRLLGALRIVWDIRKVPPHVVSNQPKRTEKKDKSDPLLKNAA